MSLQHLLHQLSVPKHTVSPTLTPTQPPGGQEKHLWVPTELQLLQQSPKGWTHWKHSLVKTQKPLVKTLTTTQSPAQELHNTFRGAGRTADPWGFSLSSVDSGRMCSSASGSKSTEHSSQQKFAEPAEPLIQPLQHCLQSLELPITHVVHERLKWCANTSPSPREMPEVTDVR